MINSQIREKIYAYYPHLVHIKNDRCLAQNLLRLAAVPDIPPLEYWNLAKIAEGISLDDVLTLKEASEMYNLDPSALRHAIRNNRFGEDEIKKSGGTWLIKKSAMERIYGSLE